MASKAQLKFLSSLSALSKEDRFCDVQIDFSNGTRKFNRLLLASLSPYFDAMLSSSMQEGLSGIVCLPTVSAEVFDAVLEYYVNGVGDLDSAVLYEIIDATEMMQMQELKQICEQNIKKSVCPENCLKVWELSRKYSSDKSLECRAFELICENFNLVYMQVEFLHLSKEDVLRLIRLKHLAKESDLLEAVLLWIEANDPDEADAVEMFNEIRLGVVEEACILKNVYRDGILKYRHIENQMKHYLQQHVRSVPQEMHETSTNTDVVIVCSASADRFNVHAWDVRERKWYDLSPKFQKGPLTAFGAAFGGQNLVISGGVREKVMCETLIFSALENTWTVGPDLVCERYKHGSVSIQNSVYSVGGMSACYVEGKGLQSGVYLNSVEQWSPNTNRWEVVGNLFKAVANAAVMKSGHMIITISGEDGSSTGTGDIQCFNTVSKCSFIIGQTDKSKHCRSDLFAQTGYLISSNYIYLLEIEGDDDAVEVKVKNCKNLPWPSYMYSANCAVAVVDDTPVGYTYNVTRKIDLTEKEVKLVALPSVPGDVRSVICAFRARMSKRCLSNGETYCSWLYHNHF